MTRRICKNPNDYKASGEQDRGTKECVGYWESLAAVSLVNKSLYISVVVYGSCSVTTYRAAKEGLA
ncbi:hypothetical protein E2C01_037108 [Portunus trituberculatus]|uniref:Uncharacterized protein n=1 Tax=Portunus trituberculatus TaxID=210409 RepID=A0A5B7F792_PORTR|nr:hypothetical protein [Portunus trituberculatus]